MSTTTYKSRIVDTAKNLSSINSQCKECFSKLPPEGSPEEAFQEFAESILQEFYQWYKNRPGQTFTLNHPLFESELIKYLQLQKLICTCGDKIAALKNKLAALRTREKEKAQENKLLQKSLRNGRIVQAVLLVLWMTFLALWWKSLVDYKVIVNVNMSLQASLNYYLNFTTKELALYHGGDGPPSNSGWFGIVATLLAGYFGGTFVGNLASSAVKILEAYFNT